MDSRINTISSSENETETLLESMSLQLFVSYAPAAMAMFDKNMCYMAASSRWMKDYGLENLNVIGKSHYEIFPEIPERWREIHRRCLSGETFSAKEDCFIRQDGAMQWLNWVVRPWYSSEQKIGGIVIFTEDVTENKIANTKLHEEKEDFRSFANISSDADSRMKCNFE